MAATQYWNRYTQKLETELVYGEAGINFLYQNPLGRSIRPILSHSSFVSKIYGASQSWPMSAAKIPAFLEKFKINMDEFEPGPFRSFNDFFIRKFKPRMRPFCTMPQQLSAPCEARYLFFDKINEDTRVSVKGAVLNPIALMGPYSKRNWYMGGALAIARLCPVDYHRFHFLDDCEIETEISIPGRFESVNPVAVNHLPQVFFGNERSLSILNTKHFGRVAMLEVGALCVGKIVQSYDKNTALHRRGEEKGYFLFGGSTVILVFEPDRIQWSEDFIEKSRNGTECFVRLGDKLGTLKT